jgi:hypothetical protein
MSSEEEAQVFRGGAAIEAISENQHRKKKKPVKGPDAESRALRDQKDGPGGVRALQDSENGPSIKNEIRDGEGDAISRAMQDAQAHGESGGWRPGDGGYAGIARCRCAGHR